MSIEAQGASWRNWIMDLGKERRLPLLEWLYINVHNPTEEDDVEDTWNGEYWKHIPGTVLHVALPIVGDRSRDPFLFTHLPARLQTLLLCTTGGVRGILNDEQFAKLPPHLIVLDVECVGITQRVVDLLPKNLVLSLPHYLNPDEQVTGYGTSEIWEDHNYKLHYQHA